MFRRGQRRREADELRARFVANREKVRSWTDRWDCPEVEWPPFPEVPQPWSVLLGEQERWLQRHAPFAEEYSWLLEARPVTVGISELRGVWEFGAGHAFERLTIRFRSVLDPEYLAEKVALGIAAAELDGWQEEDVRGLYDWVGDGVGRCRRSGMVRGTIRVGFVRAELTCAVVGRTEVVTEVVTTLTDAGLDGTPLNADGRAP